MDLLYSTTSTDTPSRTMSIMLTLDNAFGIFNNLPPRFSFSEFGLELPCEPKSFEAVDYEDMRARSIFPRRKLKVTEAFQLFFLRSNPQASRFEPVPEGTLNMLDLQIIVHGMRQNPSNSACAKYIFTRSFLYLCLATFIW